MDISYLISSELAPIQASILSDLSAQDAVALGSVSKGVRQSLNYGLEHDVYNIQKKLKKSFKDPKVFRNIQAQTGTSIVCRFARAFFANTTDRANDLELIIRTYEVSKDEVSKYKKYKPNENVAAIVAFLTADGWTPKTPQDRPVP